MSEPELHPLLVLHVPPRHEVDPQALGELAQHIGDMYGAALLVNPRTRLGEAVPPRLLGGWGAHSADEVLADLQAHIERVFFNLDWMGLEAS